MQQQSATAAEFSHLALGMKRSEKIPGKVEALAES